MTPHAPATNHHLKKEISIRFVVSYMLHSIMNQELFEKHLCNQSSHYEKCERFLLQMEAIMCYCQIDTFHCQPR